MTDQTTTVVKPDSRPFTARHDGICEECGQPIHAAISTAVRRHLWGARNIIIHKACAE